jgi:dihydrofolate reductase
VTSTLTIIVARARNGVIGHDNRLPWHLPEELQHFKRSTTGHAVIMGRKTFDSIGRPLPGRRMIVVTRNTDWRHEGCETADSLQAAWALCESPHPLVTNPLEVFVAGGAQLYEQARPLASRMLITEIDLAPEGDVHFGEPDSQEWELSDCSSHTSANGCQFDIQDWRRRSP